MRAVAAAVPDRRDGEDAAGFATPRGLANEAASEDQRTMIGRLFRRSPEPGGRRIARTPPDTVVWAIGDIHGCSDLLRVLLGAILEDVAARQPEKAALVFLGDYVDRGPDSKGVLDTLSDLSSQGGIDVHFLRGNHEERMEAFLVQPELGPGWCDYGGRECLGSFGINPPKAGDPPALWQEASLRLNRALNNRHRALLASQKASIALGDFFFAHAGAEPGVPLSEQDPKQLMWIRGRFLQDRSAFEKMVVHGHTPSPAVYADHRRIGIDTGAYATGVLTALRLSDAGRQVVQTARQGDRIDVTWRPLADSGTG